MPTELILIRHGETPHTVEGRYSGHSDPSLTERGRLQAECLARAVSGGSLQAVYSSDLARARETARRVGKRHGLEVMPRPALREQYFGRWEDWTYEEIVAGAKEAFDLWMADIWEGRPPGGECFREVYGRVVEEVQGIVARYPDETVVVVGHAGSIAATVMKTLGIPPEGIWSFRVAPASISVVRCYSQRWVLEGLNHTCHLRGI